MMIKVKKDKKMKVFELKNCLKNMKEIIQSKEQEIDFYKQ